MRKFLLAALAIVSIGVGAGVAANYTMTQGVGTTFGSIVVAGTNYAQQFICDLTTPSQCAAVSASGQLSVNVGTAGGANAQATAGTNVTTATGILGLGIVNSSTPSASFYTNGKMQPLVLDNDGNLHVEQPDWTGQGTSANNTACTPPTVNAGCYYIPVSDSMTTMGFSATNPNGATLTVYASADGGATYIAHPLTSVGGSIVTSGQFSTANSYRISTAGWSNIAFGNNGSGTATNTTITWDQSAGSGLVTIGARAA